jgi:hypothetical protein
MSFGSGSDFQKVPDPVSDLTLNIYRYSSWSNMILKVLKWHFKTYFSENTKIYYNIMVKILITLFWMVFVSVYIHFWIRIQQKLGIIADQDPQHWM